MPFEIVRNDITNMHVDAIVNTANPRPVIGLGTDSVIHEKAGPRLLRARQRIGEIAVGHAAITPAFHLPAKYVIHAVGPAWMGGNEDEELLLRSCYENALHQALEYGCRSVAFPLISTGNYGFPKDRALQIAISVFSAFLLEHEMQIYLVVFDRDSYKLSEKLFDRVASYIDENYVDEHGWDSGAVYKQIRCDRQESRLACEADVILESAAMPSQTMSLADMLKQTDIGFSEALLELIDKTGKKDSEIYKKANISKQHFSKIRNNPQLQAH